MIIPPNSTRTSPALDDVKVVEFSSRTSLLDEIRRLEKDGWHFVPPVQVTVVHTSHWYHATLVKLKEGYPT